MGLMSSVGSFLGSSSGGFLTDILGAGASAAMNYDVARRLQHDSQDWQEKMYKNRYQYTVEDMKAAGFNPVLASGAVTGSFGSGGGAVSGGASVGSSAARRQAEIQGQMMSSEIELRKAQSATAVATAERERAESELARARAAREAAETARTQKETTQVGSLSQLEVDNEIKRKNSSWIANTLREAYGLLLGVGDFAEDNDLWSKSDRALKDAARKWRDKAEQKATRAAEIPSESYLERLFQEARERAKRDRQPPPDRNHGLHLETLPHR